MEKSTLKKGGIVLLGAMTLFGTGILSWADVTEQVNPPIEKDKPGWTVVEKGVFSTTDNEKKLAEDLRNYEKVDLKQAAKPSHDVIGRYCSMFDFSNLGVDLLPGLAVNFANTSGGEVVNGIYQNWTYDEVKNHEPIKQASVFKVGLDEEGSKYGLGIYPDYASNARVEFVYSTRGLTDVNRIQVKLNSYGNQDEITVSRTYTAKAAIYNLDGSKVKDLEYGDIYVADNTHVGQPKEWSIQTSNVTTKENLQVGDLDNKIIRVVITSKKPEQIGDKNTDITEPLLVISDVHIDFNRPEVTLDAPTKDEVLQAGAGRTGSCNEQTLETTVKFWNSLDMTELGLKNRSEIYPKEGNQLSEKLRFEGERPTFYEVSAAHPFRLHTMTISDMNDQTKVSAKAFNLEELAQDGIIGKDVVKFKTGGELAGKDSLITYRIPREYFVKVNQEYDEYKVSMTYAFEPLTVDTFEDEYIKATTSARSTDTATVVLKGNSIPTFKAVDELTFTKYREVQYADAIEFTNLPKFKGVDGGFYMQHDTKADKDATQRYDDDVVQIGWRVVKDGKVYFIRQKDSVHILPAVAKADKYEIYNYDEINWNLNTSIVLEDAIFPDKPVEGSLRIIDCTGNLAATSVHPVYRCVRKDVNISNSESLNPIEKFTLADGLTYQPTSEYSYTGADLKAGKAGAVYEDLIVAKCAQAFIWYRFEGDSTALGGAMLAGAIDKLDLNTGRVDHYFSGYHTQALGDARMKSREHTIRIFAGENVQKDENGIAVIKVFKEKFNIDLWAHDATNDQNWFPADGISNKDDSYEQTKNGFFFTYNAKQQYVTASWDATSTANDAGEKWRGQNVTDTLYIRVDLSTPAMQAALKEDGIPVQVVYSPYDERYTFLEGLHDLIDHKDLPFWANTLNHVAQFGIVTGNAYNEFYTVGSTSKGLITTMITDRSIASYANFADFVNNRFGDLPNGNIHGIYKDYYAKDHGSYYVGSECLNGIQRDHNFIIAGLNLINDVDLYTYAAAPGAFTLNVMPILGTVSEDGKTLTPNEYGEALFVVSSEFAPKAEDKDAAVVENITVNKDLVAMNYLKDTVVIKPVQTAGHDSVFVYDLDKENHGTLRDGKLNLFNHYAAYRADSVETVIKGDVRVPELWLSSDKEGKEKIASIPFGEIVAGEEATQTIYVQGIDLPLSKDDPQLDGNVIDAVLPIITDGIYTSDEEIDILTAARENKAEDGSISGAIAKAVEITATPDVDDLCNTEGVFTIDGLCENLKQELALTYVPVLASDFAVDVVKTNGGRAEVTWEAVPGADFYTVQVGHTVVDPISENVFISQVLAENNSIKVTLKNGTGKDINKDIAINYFLELTGYDKDGNVVVEPEVIKGEAINPDVWVSEKAVTKVFDAELSADIIYEVRLCEYDTNRQIDIYTFDNTYSHLYRKTVDGGIILMNRGDFDTADWSTIKVEYPVADFEALATSAETTDTKVTVVEMAASSNYEVRVIAHSYCEKAQASRSALADIHTSIDEGGSGKVAFEGIEAPTANESINAAGVQVFGGQGVVTVQGAAGKVITVANVLGQTLANQVAASDNVTIAVPAGIVVVAVDGDATKVVVK